MNTLKEIEGRYYQEAEVVMLTTKEKSNLSKAYGNTLWYNHKRFNYDCQHLYILSKEKINIGDWRLDIFMDNPVPKQSDIECGPELTRKIIATTDESLGILIPYLKIGRAMKGNWKSLPKPSDSFIKKFIEEYNQDNIITKVLVEYVTYYGDEMVSYDMFPKTLYKIKVDSNNCITIKKLEPELYTREQLEQHIVNVFRDIYPDRHWESKAWDWIKENL